MIQYEDIVYTKDIKVGDIVMILGDYYYDSEIMILDWIKGYLWYVKEVNGDKVYLDTDLSERYYVKNPLHVNDVRRYKE